MPLMTQIPVEDLIKKIKSETNYESYATTAAQSLDIADAERTMGEWKHNAADMTMRRTDIELQEKLHINTLIIEIYNKTLGEIKSKDALRIQASNIDAGDEAKEESPFEPDVILEDPYKPKRETETIVEQMHIPIVLPIIGIIGLAYYLFTENCHGK